MYSVYHWIGYKISQLLIDYIINCTWRGGFHFSLHYSHQSTNSTSLLRTFLSQNQSKTPDHQTKWNFHLSFHNSWIFFSFRSLNWSRAISVLFLRFSSLWKLQIVTAVIGTYYNSWARSLSLKINFVSLLWHHIYFLQWLLLFDKCSYIGVCYSYWSPSTV